MDIPIQAQIWKKIFENSFDELRKKYNLTMNEIVLLLYLEKNEEKDTAKDIVDESMIAKSHVSKSVESLVNKKIIARITDVNDQKINHLQIINTTLVKELKEKEQNLVKNITDGINKNELKIFDDVSNKIKNNIKNIIEQYKTN
jgi:DNA-binding MarR family transcriptional regulator